MKTLYLVRHAEAIKRDSDLPDFERSLVRRGEKDAVRIARQLKKGKINPGVMISSPANRAIETAHIFAEALAIPVETVLLKQEIYDAADGSSLLPVISSLADEHDTAMIFGHDPALSLLTSQFLPEFTGTLPKGGLVAISFNIDTWGEISSVPGTTAAIHFPMAKGGEEKMLKQLKAHIADGLTRRVSEYLSTYDAKGAEKSYKELEKITRKAAGEFLKGVSKRNQVGLGLKYCASDELRTEVTRTKPQLKAKPKQKAKPKVKAKSKAKKRKSKHHSRTHASK